MLRFIKLFAVFAFCQLILTFATGYADPSAAADQPDMIIAFSGDLDGYLMECG